MDITPGCRFGRWTVIGPEPEMRGGRPHLSCRCDCGTERDVCVNSLTRGRSLSCGCLAREKTTERNQIDLVGRRYGMLTVLARASNREWVCKCDCGGECKQLTGALQSGRVRSCGCLRKKRVLAMAADRELGHAAVREALVESTSLMAILPQRKLNKNSQTGVRGVSKTKQGRYRAIITLRRKSYHLGTFDSVEEAVAARQKAEMQMFYPILDRHGKL